MVILEMMRDSLYTKAANLFSWIFRTPTCFDRFCMCISSIAICIARSFMVTFCKTNVSSSNRLVILTRSGRCSAGLSARNSIDMSHKTSCNLASGQMSPLVARSSLCVASTPSCRSLRRLLLFKKLQQNHQHEIEKPAVEDGDNASMHTCTETTQQSHSRHWSAQA
ncbi:hypothetical protein L7F22_064163 [Adiantum nelumboides]|nr:hypothetical protein [Adiantum nelumboides]